MLNIQVAALMTADWVTRKLSLPPDVRTDRVILPGYCRGDIAPLEDKLGVRVERGSRDLFDLPVMFGERRRTVEELEDYGPHTIEIIAEINHAPRLTMDQILDQARQLASQGADVIDIGCDPRADRPAWTGIDQVVRELRAGGHRVSVDSFHSREVEIACAAGAELVLSVNSSNCRTARDWGTEVVVIPDDPHDLDSLDPTVEELTQGGVPFRIDPVIEPIGFGFAPSLGRFLEARRRWPDTPMLMGVGNLTEMTGVDSAGINALLVGFCQELNIDSILTTSVINWARSAVREIDIARRLMHYAVTKGAVPKHLDERLVMLRDARLRKVDEKQLAELAARLTDTNFRLFADPDTVRIHAMNSEVHAVGDDPFLIFDELGVSDPSHAFYLGYEMAKAVTANTLGKNYTQDQALDWGILRREETSHYERRKGRKGKGKRASDEATKRRSDEGG